MDWHEHAHRNIDPADEAALKAVLINMRTAHVEESTRLFRRLAEAGEEATTAMHALGDFLRLGADLVGALDVVSTTTDRRIARRWARALDMRFRETHTNPRQYFLVYD